MEFAPWHWLVVLGVAVLLFGGKKLPELGKGMGEGLRGFKEGMKGITGNDDTAAEEAKKKETEARAYAEAKAAADARLAAEQRVATEQRAAAAARPETDRQEVARS